MFLHQGVRFFSLLMTEVNIILNQFLTREQERCNLFCSSVLLQWHVFDLIMVAFTFCYYVLSCFFLLWTVHLFISSSTNVPFFSALTHWKNTHGSIIQPFMRNTPSDRLPWIIWDSQGRTAAMSGIQVWVEQIKGQFQGDFYYLNNY